MNDIVNKLSAALYETDPAGTYCNCNDVTDEYDIEAATIVALYGNNPTADEVFSLLCAKFDVRVVDFDKCATVANMIK
jgi:hypothetical protein